MFVCKVMEGREGLSSARVDNEESVFSREKAIWKKWQDEATQQYTSGAKRVAISSKPCRHRGLAPKVLFVIFGFVFSASLSLPRFFVHVYITNQIWNPFCVGHPLLVFISGHALHSSGK